MGGEGCEQPGDFCDNSDQRSKAGSRGWFLKIFRTVLMYLLICTPASSKKYDGANKDMHVRREVNKWMRK